MVEVTVAVAADLVLVRVRDSGEGIPGDQLTSVFERFHRVDPSRVSGDGGGSGLGLTIARAIVSDHGGSLTASSGGPGCGASLTLSIPSA
jgi:signal transduction histidine kinase